MKNLSPSRSVNSNGIVIMVYPALENVLGKLCMMYVMKRPLVGSSVRGRLDVCFGEQ